MYAGAGARLGPLLRGRRWSIMKVLRVRPAEEMNMAIVELSTEMVCTRTSDDAARTETDDDFLFELVKPDEGGDEFVDAGSAVACYCCCYCRVVTA